MHMVLGFMGPLLKGFGLGLIPGSPNKDPQENSWNIMTLVGVAV